MQGNPLLGMSQDAVAQVMRGEGPVMDMIMSNIKPANFLNTF